MAAKDGKPNNDEDAGKKPSRPSLKVRLATLVQRLRTAVVDRLEGPRQRVVQLGWRLIGLVRRRPWFCGAIVFGSLSTIVAVTAIWMIAYNRAHRKPQVIPLPQVLARLDSGDYEAARDMAARLFAHGAQNDQELGGALFVIGSVAFRDAEVKEEPAEKKKLYLVAARYLEEAREYGLPPDRAVEALETLAQSYFLVNRFAAAQPVLRDALQSDTSHRRDLLWMLTTAYIRDQEPQWQKALEANQQYLAQRDLEKEERLEASLLQCELLFQAGDHAGCLKAMEAIDASARSQSTLIVIRGRLLMMDAERLLADAQARKDDAGKERARAKYLEAIETLKQAKANEQLDNKATRQASYLTALCLLQLEDYKSAETQFARTYSEFIGTQESIAAGLGEAEMQRRRGQFEESLTSYRRVLYDARGADEYSNAWVPLGEFRRRVEQGYFAFLAGQNFSLAIDLTNSMHPVFPESRSVQLRAEAQRTQADQLARSADSLPRAAGAKVASQYRAEYRDAGRSFARLARLREATEDLGGDLWAAGECFLKGRDYERAVKFLEKYLEYEPRKKRPRALVSLAEALLARNQLGASLKPVLECLAFHAQDPDCYRARVVAAQIYSELGVLDEAKKMLLENVENETLTPQSAEWRDSIFLLGKLLHQEAGGLMHRAAPLSEDVARLPLEKIKEMEEAHLVYLEAVRHMSDAVRRYPEVSQTIETRYLIAESHRQLIRWPRARFNTTVLESTRAQMKRQIDQQLQAAADEYLEIRKTLIEKQERDELSPIESAILRNSHFAGADMLFELKKYAEAIDEYTLAVTRYQNQPEVLEALVQIANCQRALNRPGESRGTLRQAQYILQRIRPELPFEKTTRYSREEWGRLLTWMAAI